MKPLLLVAGALLLGAPTAFAEGFNLSWNDCGLSGTQNATFPCNSNTGTPFTAVGSFIAPPGGLPEFLGLSAQVDIKTTNPNLPDWWRHGASHCRGTTGLSVSFDFTTNVNCLDFFSGQAAGGFAYDVQFGTPDRARLRLQCAVPFDNRGPLDDTSEYYAFKFSLLRAKTTGSGSCAGCHDPACIVLNEIQLFQPPEQGYDPVIVNPADRHFVTWQSLLAGCPTFTATRSATWGRLKSMYR